MTSKGQAMSSIIDAIGEYPVSSIYHDDDDDDDDDDGF